MFWKKKPKGVNKVEVVREVKLTEDEVFNAILKAAKEKAQMTDEEWEKANHWEFRRDRQPSWNITFWFQRRYSEGPIE